MKWTRGTGVLVQKDPVQIINCTGSSDIAKIISLVTIIISSRTEVRDGLL